jgi:hypothetical protein
MVDLTSRRARLIDLVPGRSGAVYADWLDRRDPGFITGELVTALDPFRGYKNAIDAKLDDAHAVIDAFHVVKLAFGAGEEVRLRVQQDTSGRRDRKATSCPASAGCCRPVGNASRLVNNGASLTGWNSMTRMTRYSSPGRSLSEYVTPTTPISVATACVKLRLL